MILEGIRPADVPNYRPRIPVPALVHDTGEVRAPLSRRRDVPGPQGVRPESRGWRPSDSP